LIFFLNIGVNAQEVISTPERTPEQEATRQTEKMQQELNLTPDQAKKIYEINLKYARERQISNSRAEAIERTKNKDTELQKVLSEDQYVRLQDKRYDQTKYRTITNNTVTGESNTQYRATTVYRTGRPVNQTPNTNNYSTFRAGNTQQKYQRQPVPVSNNNNNTTSRKSGNYTPSSTTRSAAPSNNNQNSSGSTYRAVRPSGNSNSTPTNSNRTGNNSRNTTTPSRSSNNNSSSNTNNRR